MAIGFSTAVTRYGATRAVEMFKEYNDAIDSTDKLVRDNGIDSDHKRFGKLSLAFHIKLGPALIGGNVVVLKPSERTPPMGWPLSSYCWKRVSHSWHLAAGVAGPGCCRSARD